MLAVPAGVLVFTSALNFLIIFAGTVIAAVYFCIGLAALLEPAQHARRAAALQDAAVAVASAGRRRLHRDRAGHAGDANTSSPRSS